MRAWQGGAAVLRDLVSRLLWCCYHTSSGEHNFVVKRLIARWYLPHANVYIIPSRLIFSRDPLSQIELKAKKRHSERNKDELYKGKRHNNQLQLWHLQYDVHFHKCTRSIIIVDLTQLALFIV